MEATAKAFCEAEFNLEVVRRMLLIDYMLLLLSSCSNRGRIRSYSHPLLRRACFNSSLSSSPYRAKFLGHRILQVSPSSRNGSDNPDFGSSLPMSAIMLTLVTHKDADIFAVKSARLLITSLRASLASSILGDCGPAGFGHGSLSRPSVDPDKQLILLLKMDSCA
jgi:hypothetical protein